jgi:RNA polymerase sigma-70 factor (ECF subfamily)
LLIIMSRVKTKMMEAVTEVYANWADLVGRVRGGDRSGAEVLYHTVTGNARAKLRRTVEPQLVDDRLHDIVVTVLEAIHGGMLREPDRLMGFVRTVTQRQVSAHIRSNITRRRRLTQIGPLEFPSPREHSPEAAFVDRERTEGLRKLLKRLRARDREILIRFYCHEQDQNEICREMNLTATQFRLFKSRAIARCSDYARRGAVPAGRIQVDSIAPAA